MVKFIDLYNNTLIINLKKKNMKNIKVIIENKKLIVENKKQIKQRNKILYVTFSLFF